MAETTPTTLVTHTRNHSQVQRQRDLHPWNAGTPRNCGLSRLFERLDDSNILSEDFDHGLKEHLTNDEQYNGLHSRSSQHGLEARADASTNWLDSDDTRGSSPSTRKAWYHDAAGFVNKEHPTGGGGVV